MKSFPIAAVMDGKVQRVFYGPTAFYGMDGTYHPDAVWPSWTDADWARECPQWTLLPIVNVVPSNPAKRFTEMPVEFWTVSAEAVTVAYDEEDVAEDELLTQQNRLIQERAAAVQRHMDTQVQGRGYDGIASCVTYADEPAVPKFQEEGRAARAWRSLCWAVCYDLLGQVARGEIDPLSNEELIAALPALVWPAEPAPEPVSE